MRREGNELYLAIAGGGDRDNAVPRHLKTTVA
jgi:hypothetical protein